MPLFSPVYDEKYLKAMTILLKAIRDKTFTEDLNDLSEQILEDEPGDYNCWYIKKMYILSQPKTNELYEQ